MNKIVIKNKWKLFLTTLLIFSHHFLPAQSSNYSLINKKATSKTVALYENLQWYKGKGIMFGHEDDLASGVTWKNEDGRSDIQEVCNDFPAVFGWDVSKIGIQSTNRDGIDFSMMKQWIQLTYKSGGINTLTWLMDNPVSKKNCEEITPAVTEILPEGNLHEFYKSRLDQFADFIQELNLGKSENKLIPIIFRPFPLGSESTYWWSENVCSPADYKALWQFTVDYLVETRGLNTLIFAFSTDALISKDEFEKYYPGDEYVDIIGLNIYDSGNQEFVTDLSKKLLILNTIGIDKKKVTAITETGYKLIPANDWWTEKLLKGVFRDRNTANISYLMVGKNISSNHFYAPYPEHSSAENFKRLYENMYTLFLEDIPDVYVAR